MSEGFFLILPSRQFQADGNLPTKDWLFSPFSTPGASVSRILKSNVSAALSHDSWRSTAVLGSLYLEITFRPPTGHLLSTPFLDIPSSHSTVIRNDKSTKPS